MALDAKGRLTVNGKVISDGAAEQRLRRFCTPKKSGCLKCGKEIKEMFDDLEKRPDLLLLWKESLLNKDRSTKTIVMNTIPFETEISTTNLSAFPGRV